MLRLLGACVAIMVLLVAAVACDDDPEPPSLGDVVAGDVEDGTTVTVDGTLERVLDERALLVGGDGGTIVVVQAPAASGPAIDEGEEIVVTGVVRPLTEEVRGRVEGDLPDDVADDLIEADVVRERFEER